MTFNKSICSLRLLSSIIRNNLNDQIKTQIKNLNKNHVLDYNNCNFIDINKQKIKKHCKISSLNIKSVTPYFIHYNGDDWNIFKKGLEIKELTKVHQDLNYYKIRLPYTNKNDVFELFLIKWEPLSKTFIHNYLSNGYIMKIMEGTLHEKQ